MKPCVGVRRGSEEHLQPEVLAVYASSVLWDGLSFAVGCGADEAAHSYLAALRGCGPVRTEDLDILWDDEVDELLRWWPMSDGWSMVAFATIVDERRRGMWVRRRQPPGVAWQTEGF